MDDRVEDQPASTMEGEEADASGADLENQTQEGPISEIDTALDSESTDPEEEAGDGEAPVRELEQAEAESEGGDGAAEPMVAQEDESSELETTDDSVEEAAPQAGGSGDDELETPGDASSEVSPETAEVDESVVESAEETLEDASEQVESETAELEESALEVGTDEEAESQLDPVPADEAAEEDSGVAPDESVEPTDPSADEVDDPEIGADVLAEEPVAGTEEDALTEEPAVDGESESNEDALADEAVAESEEEALAEVPPSEGSPNGNEIQTPGLDEEVASETEAQAPERPVAEPDDGREWYVVHCYSGYENKVRHNLEQRIETMDMKGKIFDVVVPTEEEMEVRNGKRRTVERRVFPGYILVQMVMDEDSWYVVRNTPGVTGFVGMGNDPTPLRPEEVSQIVKRMEAEAPRIKVTFDVGQKVRIIDGPFNDFIGTVDDIDMDKAKVRVMVSFFGRDTPVELDFLQVEKA